MYCMKCGKDTKSDRIFCDACLTAMQQSPVKPGTPIQLPNRSASAAKKNPSRRKQQSPEEKLLRMQGILRVMSICLIAAVLALGLTVTLLIHTLQPQSDPEPNGKNYTTVDRYNLD